MNRIVENNQVTICGEIVSDFTFRHEVFGEGFYMVNVSVNRMSNQPDIIPLMVSDRLVDVTQSYVGTLVDVSGQLRSYNRHDGMKNHLDLCIFVLDLEFIGKSDEPSYNNKIYLDGYICKKPIYRKTPLGREISDLMLAVNRPYGKSDYIPCIAWGRNARFACKLSVGSHVSVIGRIQSRVYEKKISDVESEKRIAYEVSLSKVQIVDEFTIASEE